MYIGVRCLQRSVCGLRFAIETGLLALSLLLVPQPINGFASRVEFGLWAWSESTMSKKSRKVARRVESYQVVSNFRNRSFSGKACWEGVLKSEEQ